VLKARKLLGIPGKGLPREKAIEWYFNEAHKYDPVVVTLDPFTLAQKEKRIKSAQWYDSDMPLEKIALELVKKFGLPIRAIRYISHYVLDGDNRWIRNPIFAEAVPIQPLFDSDLHCIMLIDPWTTKKQWAEIWDTSIKPALDSMQAKVGKPQRRRMSTDSWDEQMKRWSEWHELILTKRLTQQKAIEEWEAKHIEQWGKYDISTVSKAVRDFEKLIKP
jgi:hypothetical protein